MPTETRSMKQQTNDPAAAPEPTTAAPPTNTSAVDPAIAPRDESGTESGTTSGGTSSTSDTSRTSSETTSTSTSKTVTEKPKERQTKAQRRAQKVAKLRAKLLTVRVKLAEMGVSDSESSENESEDEQEQETPHVERTSGWVEGNPNLGITMETSTDAAGNIVSRYIRKTPSPAPDQLDGTTMHYNEASAAGVFNRTSAIEAIQWYPKVNVARRKIVESVASAKLNIEDLEEWPPFEDIATKPTIEESVQRMPAAQRETPARNNERRSSELDIRELANAIALAARSAQPAAAARQDQLPVFSGQSSEWLPFKVAFEESSAQLSELENLSKLRRSLRGPARDAVQCLFVGTTTSEEVMKLLKARFGRPDALVMAEMKKLRELPRLTENAKEVCVFASRVSNITATVKALGRTHYLYNPEIVRTVIEKFPPTLRYRYYDFAPTQPDDQPDLVTLTKFLEQTADRCGAYAPAEHMQEPNRREPSIRKTVHTYHIDGQKPKSESCPICKKTGHIVPDCSSFKKEPVPTRWELAKEARLCFRCLRVRRFNPRHTCKPKTCEIGGCTHLHHRMLHSPPAIKPPPETEDEQKNEEKVSSARGKNVTALLKIVPVTVRGPKSQLETFALLDDGSTCSIVESQVAEKIGAKGMLSPFTIEGVAGARIEANQSMRVHIKISGRHSDSEYEIAARTMNKLQLSPQRVAPEVVAGLQHLEDIAEDLVYEDGTPTVLIGQDNWHLLLSHAVRRGENNQPVASLTDLGWVLHGTKDRKIEKIPRHRVSYVAAPQQEGNIEQMVRDHFSLESLCVEPRRSFNDSEKRAIAILEKTTSRLPAGGFETGLLWRRDDFTPPNSYDTALHRLTLIEKKLDRDTELKKRYTAQIEGFIENDYAEEAPTTTTRPNKVWYLPHFSVVNPEKPEKLRIVHDAAAKSRGTSLNDLLLSGPDLLQSLPGVLMRFRQRQVAVTADIQEMFMRIAIREEDRDMQRFLWRGDRRDGPPIEYRMKSVIFGATSSPSTAIYVKNKNAEYFNEKHPEAATAIVRNHYVDDYLASYDSEEEALRVSNQFAFIHSRGNFFLRKWASNSERIRGQLAPGERTETVRLDSEKILGMVWRTQTDTLSFNINERKLPTPLLDGSKTPTKREALRVVMSIYDPLGLATPITVQAKRILQDTWRSGIDWDTELQPAETEAWRKWVTEAKQLSSLAIPRCYPALAQSQRKELHTFVDASNSAYSAATYWRVRDSAGQVHVSLIVAKGRVAPLKITSIPRLELQAALLGGRLVQTVTAEHDLQADRRVFWSDSRTVLTWLRKGPRDYKPFVSHRVAEIGETTKTTEWRWVPTKENVADDATRDTPLNFGSTHRWFVGPAFLYLPETDWPQEIENEQLIDNSEERINSARQTALLTSRITRVAAVLKLH